MPCPTHRQRRGLETIRSIPARKASRCLGRPLPKYDNRTVLEAVLWIERAGSRWRDLPAEFGKWDTICQRFHSWRQDGVFSDDWFARLAADLEVDLDTVSDVGHWLGLSATTRYGAGPAPGRRRPGARD